MRLRLSTLKLSKTIELHDVTKGELYATRMLQTHAPATFSVIVFILIDAFLTVHTDTICMRFRFNSLSKAFSNRCGFVKNAQRISVVSRPKRTEMYAFSNENALV